MIREEDIMKRKGNETRCAGIILVFAIGCMVVIAGCTQTAPTGGGATIPAAPSPAYRDVTPAEAKSLIDNNPDLIVIDVSPNYAQGHLPGAVSYYIGDGSLDRAIPALDRNGKYLVYCHVDSVAIRGAQKLIDAGFVNVYRLQGNYKAWVDAGYPVEK
jgi:adenylyltransferase/sulfurtransferase